MNKIFPELARPPEDMLSAAPSEVRTYIAEIEHRLDQYERINDLLRQMDVFPDILHRIDRIAKEVTQGDEKAGVLVVGDTEHDLTQAYKAGAIACRSGTGFWLNPFPNSSQDHYDWSNGHNNEAAGLHHVDGIDVITAPGSEDRFEVTSALTP